MMAASVVDKPTDAENRPGHALQLKRETVQRMVDAALFNLQIKVPSKPRKKILCELSRDGVAYLGGEPGWRGVEATDDDWTRLLSEGLGATFSLEWTHANLSWEDLLMLRLGEPIFDHMREWGLNPKWDGTEGGDFTITAVDGAGVKLAVAMALHPRVGTDSPLSLVSSLHTILWQWHQQTAAPSRG